MGATGRGVRDGARTSSRQQLTVLAVVIALLGGGCGNGTGSPLPAASDASSPAAPGTDSPAPESAALREFAAPIASILFAEDPESELVAIVGFGRNHANLAGMEIYQAADGSGGAVVGYSAAGERVVLAFDAEGRPASALADDGGTVDAVYTADEVEVTVTDPDGTTDRRTGPLATGFVPLGRPGVIGLAELAMAEPQEDYPLRVWTSGVVEVKTTRKDGKSIPQGAVGYFLGGCVPSDPDVDCGVSVRRSGNPALVTVTSIIRNPVSAVPGVKIWRTRDECEAAKASRATNYRSVGAGLSFAAAIIAVTALRPRPERKGYLDKVGMLAIATLLIGQSISHGPSQTAVDCRTAPNLDQIRLDLLNSKDQVTVNLSVKALPTPGCEQPSVNSLRIREPEATVTVTPFIPSHRSTLATGRPGSVGNSPVPALGSVAFDATACAIEMTGAFDFASLFKWIGLGMSEVAFKRNIGENRVTLSIEPSEVVTDPSPVTGDFAFTLALPDAFLWAIQASIGQRLTGVMETMPPDWYGCHATITIAGKLTGKNVVKGAVWIADGKAKGASSSTLEGCEATDLKESPPKALSGITWLLKGDATRMNGRLLIPDADGGPTLVLKVALTTK